MGAKIGFICGMCGLSARVSGGPDSGMRVCTDTRYCPRCQNLIDVETSWTNFGRHVRELRPLIARGKEQGYLTYAQVNDHLPSEIVDPEQIEDIVNTVNEMGIPVYEEAPGIESLRASAPLGSAGKESIEVEAKAGFDECPSCHSTDLIPWKKGAPCPRCGGTMTDSGRRVRWD